MKKATIIFIIIFLLLNSIAFSYSESFEFMIGIMNIPKENTNHKPLNESLYNAYSLFVYGSPLDGYEGQRFKEVVEGRWIKGSASNDSGGIKGEYWILRRK